MKSYEQMSDFEVNKAVAERLYGYKGPVGEHMPNGVKAADETRLFYTESDYCNNPSDAWPVIVDNAIAIKPYGMTGSDKTWEARKSRGLSSPTAMHANPLRAAMIVFLMMGDK